MIPLIYSYKDIKVKYHKLNSLQDILHFILVHFDIKCKISCKLFIFLYLNIFMHRIIRIDIRKIVALKKKLYNL